MNKENSPADLAIKALRVKVLLDEVPKTELAKSIGIKRTTLGEHLKSKDMSINEYLEIASYLKVNPLELLNEAMQKSEKIKSATSQPPSYSVALSIDNI